TAFFCPSERVFANVRSDCACFTRSSLKASCPGWGVGSVPLFDLKWLATTETNDLPYLNVCAIGSRAMSHTVSSMIVFASPDGFTTAGLKMIALVMTSVMAASCSAAGVGPYAPHFDPAAAVG